MSAICWYRGLRVEGLSPWLCAVTQRLDSAPLNGLKLFPSSNSWRFRSYNRLKILPPSPLHCTPTAVPLILCTPRMSGNSCGSGSCYPIFVVTERLEPFRNLNSWTQYGYRHCKCLRARESESERESEREMESEREREEERARTRGRARASARPRAIAARPTCMFVPASNFVADRHIPPLALLLGLQRLRRLFYPLLLIKQ